MESVFGAICAVLGIFGLPMFLLWQRSSRLKERLDRVERELAGMAAGSRPASVAQAPAHAAHVAVPMASPARTTPPPQPAPAPGPPMPAAAPTAPRSVAPVMVDAKPSVPAGPTKWGTLERKFAENWTGILGAVILVTGIGFLGVYAALHVTPLLRFIMINVIGAALFGGYWFFRSKHALGQFSLWLRSASGAVILFAAVGAIFVPGIQWTEDEAQGLAVLLPAIVFNLACGLLGGSQMFASLHVVLSLAALATAPQGIATLVIGGTVVFAGLFYSFPLRREPHTIVTLASYFIYHLYWRSAMPQAPALPDPAAIAALAILLLTGIAAVLLHYRDVYRSPSFKMLSFLTHVFAWFYVANAAAIYATGSKWAVFPVAAAALLVFLVADRARRKDIQWLYATDTLVAQGLAVLACMFLFKWEIEPYYIWTLLTAETMLFVALTVRQQSKVVAAISIYLFYGAMIVAQIAAIQHANQHLVIAWTFSAVLFAFGLLASAWFFHARGKNPLVFSAALNPERVLGSSGILPGLSVVYLALLRSPGIPPGWLVVVAVVVLLLVRARLETIGLLAGSILAVLAISMVSWWHLSDLPTDSIDWAAFGHTAGPAFIAMAMGFLFSRMRTGGRYLTIPGFVLLMVHTLVVLYIVIERLSPFAYSSALLLLGLVTLEIGRRVVPEKLGSALATLHRLMRMPGHSGGVTDPLHAAMETASWILALMFLRSHILVDLQWEHSFGPLPARFAIELFALAVFLYQAAFFGKGRPDNKHPSLLDRFSPLRWEGFLLFFIFTGLADLPDRFYPLLFSGMSLGLLLVGRWIVDLSRLRVYALFSSIAACFNIAFVSTSGVTPSSLWSDQPWIGAVLALVLQFGFAAVFYRYAALETVSFPGILSSWSSLPGRAGTGIRLLLFYPIFIASALFLWWSFDKSILTLLWVTESFAIFLLALFLGMNHFRILSTIALGVCLVRLIAYDMAQASYVMRAVVFVGVGLMMLAMNALYARFRTRFQK